MTPYQTCNVIAHIGGNGATHNLALVSDAAKNPASFLVGKGDDFTRQFGSFRQRLLVLQRLRFACKRQVADVLFGGFNQDAVAKPDLGVFVVDQFCR